MGKKKKTENLYDILDRKLSDQVEESKNRQVLGKTNDVNTAPNTPKTTPNSPVETQIQRIDTSPLPTEDVAPNTSVYNPLGTINKTFEKIYSNQPQWNYRVADTTEDVDLSIDNSNDGYYVRDGVVYKTKFAIKNGQRVITDNLDVVQNEFSIKQLEPIGDDSELANGVYTPEEIKRFGVDPYQMPSPEDIKDIALGKKKLAFKKYSIQDDLQYQRQFMQFSSEGGSIMPLHSPLDVGTLKKTMNAAMYGVVSVYADIYDMANSLLSKGVPEPLLSDIQPTGFASKNEDTGKLEPNEILNSTITGLGQFAGQLPIQLGAGKLVSLIGKVNSISNPITRKVVQNALTFDLAYSPSVIKKLVEGDTKGALVDFAFNSLEGGTIALMPKGGLTKNLIGALGEAGIGAGTTIAQGGSMSDVVSSMLIDIVTGDFDAKSLKTIKGEVSKNIGKYDSIMPTDDSKPTAEPTKEPAPTERSPFLELNKLLKTMHVLPSGDIAPNIITDTADKVTASNISDLVVDTTQPVVMDVKKQVTKVSEKVKELDSDIATMTNLVGELGVLETDAFDAKQRAESKRLRESLEEKLQDYSNIRNAHLSRLNVYQALATIDPTKPLVNASQFLDNLTTLNDEKDAPPIISLIQSIAKGVKFRWSDEIDTYGQYNKDTGVIELGTAKNSEFIKNPSALGQTMIHEAIGHGLFDYISQTMPTEYLALWKSGLTQSNVIEGVRNSFKDKEGNLIFGKDKDEAFGTFMKLVKSTEFDRQDLSNNYVDMLIEELGWKDTRKSLTDMIGLAKEEAVAYYVGQNAGKVNNALADKLTGKKKNIVARVWDALAEKFGYYSEEKFVNDATKGKPIKDMIYKLNLTDENLMAFDPRTASNPYAALMAELHNKWVRSVVGGNQIQATTAKNLAFDIVNSVPDMEMRIQLEDYYRKSFTDAIKYESKPNKVSAPKESIMSVGKPDKERNAKYDTLVESQGKSTKVKIQKKNGTEEYTVKDFDERGVEVYHRKKPDGLWQTRTYSYDDILDISTIEQKTAKSATTQTGETAPNTEQTGEEQKGSSPTAPKKRTAPTGKKLTNLIEQTPILDKPIEIGGEAPHHTKSINGVRISHQSDDPNVKDYIAAPEADDRLAIYIRQGEAFGYRELENMERVVVDLNDMKEEGHQIPGDLVNIRLQDISRKVIPNQDTSGMYDGNGSVQKDIFDNIGVYMGEKKKYYDSAFRWATERIADQVAHVGKFDTNQSLGYKLIRKWALANGADNTYTGVVDYDLTKRWDKIVSYGRYQKVIAADIKTPKKPKLNDKEKQTALELSDVGKVPTKAIEKVIDLLGADYTDGALKAFARLSISTSDGAGKELLDSIAEYIAIIQGNGLIADSFNEFNRLENSIKENYSSSNDNFQLNILLAEMKSKYAGKRIITDNVTLDDLELMFGGDFTGNPKFNKLFEILSATKKKDYTSVVQSYIEAYKDGDYVLTVDSKFYENMIKAIISGNALSKKDIAKAGSNIETLLELMLAKEMSKSTEQQFTDGMVSKQKGTLYYGSKSVEVTYQILELDDVHPSHYYNFATKTNIPNENYPIAFQHRNRESEGFESILPIINNVIPVMLMPYENVPSGGAPIITQSGHYVIAGNGRTMALKELYAYGNTKYKDYLVNNASEFGFDSEAVSKMENPIIVRTVNVNDADALEISEESNKKQMKALTKSEEVAAWFELLDVNGNRALNDSIDNYINNISKSEDELTDILGNTLSAEFMNSLTNKYGFLNQFDKGSLYNSNNLLSKEGKEYLIEVIGAHVLGTTTAKVLNNSRVNIENGVYGSLPYLLKDKKSNGYVYKNIRRALEIAQIYDNWFQLQPANNNSFKSFYDSVITNLYNDILIESPETLGLFEMLWKSHKVSAKKIRETIRDYSKDVHIDTEDLFAAPPLTDEEIKKIYAEKFPTVTGNAGVNYYDGIGTTDLNTTDEIEAFVKSYGDNGKLLGYIANNYEHAPDVIKGKFDNIKNYIESNQSSIGQGAGAVFGGGEQTSTGRPSVEEFDRISIDELRKLANEKPEDEILQNAVRLKEVIVSVGTALNKYDLTALRIMDGKQLLDIFNELKDVYDTAAKFKNDNSGTYEEMFGEYTKSFTDLIPSLGSLQSKIDEIGELGKKAQRTSLLGSGTIPPSENGIESAIDNNVEEIRSAIESVKSIKTEKITKSNFNDMQRKFQNGILPKAKDVIYKVLDSILKPANIANSTEYEITQISGLRNKYGILSEYFKDKRNALITLRVKTIAFNINPNSQNVWVDTPGVMINAKLSDLFATADKLHEVTLLLGTMINTTTKSKQIPTLIREANAKLGFDTTRGRGKVTPPTVEVFDKPKNTRSMEFLAPEESQGKYVKTSSIMPPEPNQDDTRFVRRNRTFTQRIERIISDAIDKVGKRLAGSVPIDRINNYLFDPERGKLKSLRKQLMVNVTADGYKIQTTDGLGYIHKDAKEIIDKRMFRDSDKFPETMSKINNIIADVVKTYTERKVSKLQKTGQYLYGTKKRLAMEAQAKIFAYILSPLSVHVSDDIKAAADKIEEIIRNTNSLKPLYRDFIHGFTESQMVRIHLQSKNINTPKTRMAVMEHYLSTRFSGVAQDLVDFNDIWGKQNIQYRDIDALLGGMNISRIIADTHLKHNYGLAVRDILTTSGLAKSLGEDDVPDEGFEAVTAKDIIRYGMTFNTEDFGMQIEKSALNEIRATGDIIYKILERQRYKGDVVKSAMRKLGEEFISEWKKSRTVMNVPTHIANFISNLQSVGLAGVPLYKLPLLMKKASEALKGKGKYSEYINAAGFNASLYSASEFDTALNEIANRSFGEMHLGEKAAKALSKVTLTDTAIGKKLSGAYNYSEMLFKSVVMINEIEQGSTFSKARQTANDYLFDYSEVSNLVRQLRKYPLMGGMFITWSLKALPMTLKAAKRNPITTIKMLGLLYGMRELLRGVFESEEFEEAYLLAENKLSIDPAWYPSGHDARGNPLYVSGGRYSTYQPVNAIVNMVGNLLLDDGNVKSIINDNREFLNGLLGPVGQIAVKIATQKNPITGQELGEYDTSPFTIIAKSVAEAVVPIFTPVVGQNWNKWEKLLGLREQTIGTEKTSWQLLSDLVLGFTGVASNESAKVKKESYVIKNQMGNMKKALDNAQANGDEERVAEIEKEINILKSKLKENDKIIDEKNQTLTNYEKIDSLIKAKERVDGKRSKLRSEGLKSKSLDNKSKILAKKILEERKLSGYIR